MIDLSVVHVAPVDPPNARLEPVVPLGPTVVQAVRPALDGLALDSSVADVAAALGQLGARVTLVDLRVPLEWL